MPLYSKNGKRMGAARTAKFYPDGVTPKTQCPLLSEARLSPCHPMNDSPNIDYFEGRPKQPEPQILVADDLGLLKTISTTEIKKKEIQQVFGETRKGNKNQGISVLEWLPGHKGVVVGRTSGVVEVFKYLPPVVVAKKKSYRQVVKSSIDGRSSVASSKTKQGAPSSSSKNASSSTSKRPAKADVVEMASDDEDDSEDEEGETTLKNDKFSEDEEQSDEKKPAKNSEDSTNKPKEEEPQGKFVTTPVFSFDLKLALHPKDPTKNEKLIFATGCCFEKKEQMSKQEGATTSTTVQLREEEQDHAEPTKLLVLSSLGNVWMLDLDMGTLLAAAVEEDQDGDDATTSKKKYNYKKAESPSSKKLSTGASGATPASEELLHLKPTFTLPGTFIQPLDKKWATSIKPRPCVKAASFREDVEQLAYCGVDNDVRVFDVRERKLVWKAKNLPNDKLDLQVPIRYSRIHWATEALDCDTALVCCTMDGKIRVFDMKAKQLRALFDLPVVYKRERSIGHAGAAGKEERPITASVLTDNGILAVGDTVGNLDIFDLTKTKPYLTGTPDSLLFQNKMVKDIPKIASIAHHEYVWKGQIIKYLGACAPEGSAIRSLCFIPQTKQLASVGLGRFATVHKALESDKRREQDKKTYMKQKLTAVVALPPVDLSKVKVEGEGEAETQKTDNSKARTTPASSSKNTAATTTADADEPGSDGAEEEEEEGLLSDDDIVSELSYGSYVQEFDDDDESSEEVAPPPKKRRNRGRK
ncbi:unnamed protein product [Amoebophrya sp. A120]|nr:unnamed protein product [Amoebophrya sp. A120]|eukprot:GSA120T00017024001.1